MRSALELGRRNGLGSRQVAKLKDAACCQPAEFETPNQLAEEFQKSLFSIVYYKWRPTVQFQ